MEGSEPGGGAAGKLNSGMGFGEPRGDLRRLPDRDPFDSEELVRGIRKELGGYEAGDVGFRGENKAAEV